MLTAASLDHNIHHLAINEYYTYQLENYWKLENKIGVIILKLHFWVLIEKVVGM